MTIEERNKIVEENIGLVGYTINKFYKAFAFMNDEDAYQEGLVGLIRAVDVYERKEYDFAFTSFAVNYIRYCLHRYFLKKIFKTGKNYKSLENAYIDYKSHKKDIEEGISVMDLPISDISKTLINNYIYGMCDLEEITKWHSKDKECNSLTIIINDIRNVVMNAKTPKKSREIYMDYVNLIVVGYEPFETNKILRKKYNCTRQNIHAVIKGMNKRVVDSLGDEYA